MAEHTGMLLAESGATKTEWRLLKGVEVRLAFRTAGFNANVMGWPQMEAQFQQEVLPVLVQADQHPLEVVFYGSSFADVETNRQMQQLIAQQLGLNPSQVTVEHDLLAAARASAQRSEGLVIILGTGSNACRYDGQEIVEQRGGHGWLFGDEGSGCDLGKQLLKAGLDGDLPLALAQAFEQWRGQSMKAIRNEVYSAAKPNVLLASFCEFLHLHRTEPYVEQLIRDRMGLFADLTVARMYTAGLPVYAIGSVAAAFLPQLTAEFLLRELPAPIPVPSPIDGLVRFHTS